MATPLDFAKALLNRLGLPQTQNRLVGLVAFAAIEGGHWHNGARFNPMNTSLSMPGAVNVIGAVKAYTSWDQGIEATARTMAQSNMAAMLNALKADATPQQFLASVTKTQWCPQSSPGCSAYENSNAVALYNARANEQDSQRSSLTAGPGVSAAAGWIKAHPISTVIIGLTALSGVVWYFRPDLFRRIPVVGQLAARENPVRGLERRLQARKNPVRRLSPVASWKVVSSDRLHPTERPEDGSTVYWANHPSFNKWEGPFDTRAEAQQWISMQ